MCTNDDVHILAGDAVDEGERDKIIQPPASSTNAPISEPAAQPLPSIPMPNPNLLNSIPFPSEPSVHPQPEPLDEPLPEALPEDDLPQELGQHRRVQKKPPGAYKRMAKGLPPLEANVAEINAEIAEDKDDLEVELPPDFALIGTLGTEPKLLDDVLSGPHAKEWQTALD